MALTPLLFLVLLPFGPEGDVAPKTAAMDTDETQPMEHEALPTEVDGFSLAMPLGDIPATQPDAEEVSDEDEDEDEDADAAPSSKVGMGIMRC